MLPPLIERRRLGPSHRERERGVTLALVALAIFSIVAMAALSIDVGTLYEASAEAQRVADAAALAAAKTISMSGLTGDPTNSSTAWQQICDNATAIAVAVAQQSTVGGATLPAGSITVTYSAGSATGPGTANCSTLAGSSFAVNPVATVKVTRSNLSTYFSRIWGRTGSNVSATAAAEAFNPSNSAAYSPSGIVPVQPRCVKPWLVPNYAWWIPSAYSCTTACPALVDPTTGAINNPGVVTDTPGAAIGQTFWLVADCIFNSSNCVFRDPAPQANAPKRMHGQDPPNLEYLPGQIQTSFASVGVPSGPACTGVSGNYAEAIAGCDQNTRYQCGVQGANVVDLSENPGAADTTDGVQCLTHQGNGNGQDTLLFNGAIPPAPIYPFQIQIGSGNPLLGVGGVGSNDLITSSTSIVSVPIYDSANVINPSGTTNVTIVGFLQVFINSVDNFGNVNVTVMNIAGCGNAVSNLAPALQGTSPVPVRLITPP